MYISHDMRIMVYWKGWVKGVSKKNMGDIPGVWWVGWWPSPKNPYGHFWDMAVPNPGEPPVIAGTKMFIRSVIWFFIASFVQSPYLKTPTKAQAETCTARESLNLELSSAVHLLSVAMWDTCGQAQFKTRIKEDLQLFLHELASRIV